jgi:two-component system OmpR family sensor kinase
MLRTLYARLSALLALLLVGVGVAYLLINASVTRSYIQEVSQRFNRDLARNLVTDRNLVAQGRINEPAVAETFHEYMVINPSIEIYLLDADGTILSYSADPGKVKRRKVSLAPIREFLRGATRYPLLGDDPRSHDGRKAFSATPLPSSEDVQGYLYVVLRGEEVDAMESMIRESYFLRLSTWAVGVSLALGLVLGLVVLRLLTRRLHRLAGLMDEFSRSDFSRHAPYAAMDRGRGDEIDRLGETFDRMAAHIIAQLQALQRKDALRRELVAHVSHDLRTPLASLRGYLESLQLKRSALTPEQRAEYLAISLRHSERLTQLVSELFELAALDARETKPQCEPFALADLAQDVVQKFSLKAAQAEVRLTMEPPPDLPLVQADIALTERGLSNLIDNALDHTQPCGEVRLSLVCCGEQIEIAVRDTGKGIAADDLEHIFEPFHTDRARYCGNNHAGLGLAITRRIAELHGGQVRVESTVGGGTCFRLSLPIWRPAPQPPSRQAVGTPSR